MCIILIPPPPILPQVILASLWKYICRTCLPTKCSCWEISTASCRTYTLFATVRLEGGWRMIGWLLLRAVTSSATALIRFNDFAQSNCAETQYCRLLCKWCCSLAYVVGSSRILWDLVVCGLPLETRSVIAFHDLVGYLRD